MNEHPIEVPEKPRSQFRYFTLIDLIGFIIAILAVLAAVFAGFGTRWKWWHFMTGFIILKWAAISGLIAILVLILGIILIRLKTTRHSFILALIGIILCLLVFSIPLSWYLKAHRVPAIHDITTDTENPPQFVAILPLRKNADNPAEYGGPKIVVQQHAAYPDIVPAILAIPPMQAFDRALIIGRNRGWKIVVADPSEGRIEATDQTFWFGFKDDIVIRITPTDHGSKVDIRSVSRVGKSDIGTNAARIRKFLNELHKTQHLSIEG
jgi:uncharacterized protein (DUF1499 family)